jgi:hypothetical protein
MKSCFRCTLICVTSLLAGRLTASADILVPKENGRWELTNISKKDDGYWLIPPEGEHPWTSRGPFKSLDDYVIIREDSSNPYITHDGLLKARLVEDSLYGWHTRVFIEPDGSWSIVPLKPKAIEARQGKMRRQLMVDIAQAFTRYDLNALPANITRAPPENNIYDSWFTVRHDFHILWFGQRSVKLVYNKTSPKIGAVLEKKLRLETNAAFEQELRLEACLKAVRQALDQADKEKEAKTPTYLATGGYLSQRIAFGYKEQSPQGRRLGYEHDVGKSVTRFDGQTRNGNWTADNRPEKGEFYHRVANALVQHDFKSLVTMTANQPPPVSAKTYYLTVSNTCLYYAPEFLAEKLTKATQKRPLKTIPNDPDDPSKGFQADPEEGFVIMRADGSMIHPNDTPAERERLSKQLAIDSDFARRSYALIKVFAEILGEPPPPAPSIVTMPALDPNAGILSTKATPTPAGTQASGARKPGVLVFKSTARVEGMIIETPDNYNIIKRSGAEANYPKYKIETVIWGPLSTNTSTGQTKSEFQRGIRTPDDLRRTGK